MGLREIPTDWDGETTGFRTDDVPEHGLVTVCQCGGHGTRMWLYEGHLEVCPRCGAKLGESETHARITALKSKDGAGAIIRKNKRN